MSSSEVSLANILKSPSFSRSAQINIYPALDLELKENRQGLCEGQIKSKVPGKH